MVGDQGTGIRDWGTAPAFRVLRGPYKRIDYREGILPLTVLRHFDCVLKPTRSAALAAHREVKVHRVERTVLGGIDG